MIKYSGICILLLVVVGCGSNERPFTNNSRDPEAYAKDVKQLVIHQVESARKSKEPADPISVIVAEFDGTTSRPIGSYGDTYGKIHSTAKEILADCEKAKGRPPTLVARLDELKKLAETLPGTIQLPKAD